MRRQSELGVSLITALFVIVLVSVIVGVIGYVLLASMKTSHEAQVFKSSKQAAESMAYAIINEIDADKLNVTCSGVTGWCPITVNGTESKCPINLPADIQNSLSASKMSGDAYLIANCTSPIGNTYTIEVEASAPDNTTTRIYFIYQK